MNAQHHPTPAQRRFFEENVLGHANTILTLKCTQGQQRGFSVNIRGPFHLVEYRFPNHRETVLDATWAGEPESQSHLHCCWTEVQYALLSETTTAVQRNIQHGWQLSLFPDEAAARSPRQARWKRACFCFYLADHTHPAVRNLKAEVPIAITSRT